MHLHPQNGLNRIWGLRLHTFLRAKIKTFRMRCLMMMWTALACADEAAQICRFVKTCCRDLAKVSHVHLNVLCISTSSKRTKSDLGTQTSYILTRQVQSISHQIPWGLRETSAMHPSAQCIFYCMNEANQSQKKNYRLARIVSACAGEANALRYARRMGVCLLMN